jgi:hypothetical protein
LPLSVGSHCLLATPGVFGGLPLRAGEGTASASKDVVDVLVDSLGLHRIISVVVVPHLDVTFAELSVIMPIASRNPVGRLLAFLGALDEGGALKRWFGDGDAVTDEVNSSLAAYTQLKSLLEDMSELDAAMDNSVFTMTAKEDGEGCFTPTPDHIRLGAVWGWSGCGLGVVWGGRGWSVVVWGWSGRGLGVVWGGLGWP